MKRNILATIVVACAQTALVSQCEPAGAAAPKASAVTVFQGANLIDGTGAPVKENQTVIVKGKKIQSISAGVPAKIPAGARVVDAKGKTIMPCLVNAHVHLGLIKGASTSGEFVSEENDTRQLKQYGKYGVGLVVSLGDDHDCIYPVRDKRDKGLIGGSYVQTAGHGFSVPGGAPAVNPKYDEIYRLTTVADAVKHVDDLAKHKVDIIKVFVDDLHDTVPKLKPEMYKAIIAEAHRHGLKAAAHMWRLSDAKGLVEAGVNWFAHNIRDLPVDDELISAMKSHDVALVPALVVEDSQFIFKERPDWMNGKFFQDSLDPGALEYLKSDKYVPSEIEREALKVSKANLKKLYDSGVKIAFGSDTGLVVRTPGWGEHRELQLMVESGLTPQQVIKIATKDTAELLGVSDKMGTLAPGKLANLIVLDADPYLDITNTQKISSVWIDGKEQ